jgi:copper transport protein
VLVLALIGVASLTRSALRGRLAPDDAEPVTEERTMGVLRRLVVVEVVVAVVVVAITSLLVDANPGGAGVAGAAGPFDETVVVDDVLINLVAVPGTVGPTDIHLYVDDPGGGLTPPVGVTGTLSSGDITGVEVPFVAAGPGHWSAYDVDLPIAGQWELAIDVLLTEVDEISTTFTIPIGGTS